MIRTAKSSYRKKVKKIGVYTDRGSKIGILTRRRFKIKPDKAGDFTVQLESIEDSIPSQAFGVKNQISNHVRHKVHSPYMPFFELVSVQTTHNEINNCAT
jgi:hypothetical protein